MDQDLIRTAEALEQKITGATSTARLAMQPEFARVIDRLRANRVDIPSRLLRLDAALVEEAVEDRFDNMPV
ncbi:MAG: hypothetical protein MRY77_15180 [Rhodobacteraceae bacterium]|nr:hypothetical protein [Paracoccaceae bacterium]